MDNQGQTARLGLKRVALILIIAAIAAVTVILLIPEKERATMVPTEAVSDSTNSPPIDANAPTETKTATFAMG